MKRKVLVGGLVLLAAAAAVLLGRILLRDRIELPRLYGNIEAVEVPVGFRVPGRLLERLVDEGERVRKGQVLARLEGRDLEAVLGEREAEVSAARAALAELERGFRPQEVEQARQALEAASAEADRWQADLVRQRALFQREVISRRELETAESAGRASEARKREAEERYRLLAAGARQEQIVAARARLEAAERARDLARVNLEEAVVRSPVDGVVLAKHAEPGEVLAAGAPVVTVSDLGRVYLRAFVEETDLGKVRLGQRVRISIDSFPGKTYEGTISFVSEEAEFTPRTVETPKERTRLVFRVKVGLANPAGELKPGMPAEGRLVEEGEG